MAREDGALAKGSPLVRARWSSFDPLEVLLELAWIDDLRSDGIPDDPAGHPHRLKDVAARLLPEALPGKLVKWLLSHRGSLRLGTSEDALRRTPA